MTYIPKPNDVFTATTRTGKFARAKVRKEARGAPFQCTQATAQMVKAFEHERPLVEREFNVQWFSFQKVDL